MLAFLCFLLSISSHSNDVVGFEIPSGQHVSRREALVGTASMFVTALVAAPSISQAAEEAGVAVGTTTEEATKLAPSSQEFQAYGIIPDASATLSPGLVTVEV